MNEEDHNDIINNMRAGGDNYDCIIKCKFGMLRELNVNMRFFTDLLP